MLGIFKRKYKPKDIFGRPFPLEHAIGCVGKGWRPIVERLYNLCVEYNVDVHQVKEKFGGLRFYTGGAPPEFHEAVRVAENESYRTCENCGNPGKPRGGGWIKTLCDDCTKVEYIDVGYELYHLMSDNQWDDWMQRVKSGEVARTIDKFITMLKEVL